MKSASDGERGGAMPSEIRERPRARFACAARPLEERASR